MKSIVISDFSGGIQESTSPDDFSRNQWAKLRGVIPKNSTTFESQWGAQSFPTTSAEVTNAKLNQVFPLESSVGTFLVGIQEDGHIVWAKIPPADSTQTFANQIIWRTASPKNFSLNTAGDGSVEQTLSDAIFPYPDRRFLTTLPFEVYKYIKEPLPGRNWDATQDRIVERSFSSQEKDTSVPPMSVCPGVLIGCRRAQRGNALGVFTTLSDDDTSAAVSIPASYQNMVVAYVDPLSISQSWSGATYQAAQALGFTGTEREWEATKQGVVRLVTFPHFRRWPTRTDASYGTWPQTTVTENNLSVTYAATTRSKPMRVIRSTTAVPSGTTEDLVGRFQTRTYQEQTSGVKQNEFFHPYTYNDINDTMLPGRGIIPRANVGTMWNNQLILGDIEWRSDKAATADNNGRAIIPSNTAFIGALNDQNTQPHRGSFYYGEDDIDTFDPRSVFRATSSDARIAGMHVIDNRLVCITTAGSELDGVVTYTGNLGQIHPYGAGATPNVYAVRKQLVRGGVGVADHQDEGASYSRQTCLWSEAGIVVFIDRLGGVFYTDGQSCDRLDRVGPAQPDKSTYKDLVAGVGKHLFVWRDGRLLCFSIVGSGNSTAQGCWTEVVAPAAAYTSERGIYSLVGGTSELFFLVDGQVFRYAPASPLKGTIAEQPINIEVATQTIGDPSAHKKTSWLRVGMSFYTPSTCSLIEVSTKGEAHLHKNATGETTVVPTYTINPANTYETGHFDFVAPAGVGPQLVMSASFTFQGHVVLKSFTGWASSEIPSRSEP
jgi:hypothetical protein